MFNWFKYLKQKEPTITPIHYNPISNDHNDEIMNALWDIKEALEAFRKRYFMDGKPL